MFGNVFMLPKSGFGGGNELGFMPPFAKGISGGTDGPLLNLSPNGCGGFCSRSDGILLVLFGLFYANNLYAKPPCFSTPLASFLTAY